MSHDQLNDVEKETQNEIDQILNEVEQLRRELNSSADEVSVSEIVGELGGPTEPAMTFQASTPAAAETATAADTAPAELDTDQLMKEFNETFGNGGVSTGAEDGGMEDTLSELKEDVSVKSLLDQTLEEQEERSHVAAEPVPAFVESTETLDTPIKETEVVKKEISNPNGSGNSNNSTREGELGSPTRANDTPTLSMTLQGSMTLRLKYEFAGQEVSVGFSDDFFRIELADGTEFKIPVGKQKGLRRVA